MKKIKVIEVSSDTNIGGAGKCLLTLLENFDYNTFDVKVVLPKNSKNCGKTSGCKGCLYASQRI